MSFALSRGKNTLEIQEKLLKKAYDDVSKDWNQVVTETAGFVPLEVRFQRLFENGVRVQLRAQEFDSVDMRKLYLDDEFRVEPDDELEDIQEKFDKRAAFLADLKAKHSEARKKAESSQAKNKTPESKIQESASESAPSVEE